MIDLVRVLFSESKMFFVPSRDAQSGTILNRAADPASDNPELWL